VSNERTTDILVIGSGIAGLTYALAAAEVGQVTLVTKKERAESNTNWAQGGVAAVLGPDDRPDLHIGDTLVAGAGLCHRDRVEILVHEGPTRVRELMAWGADFQRTDGGLALGREGGHSRRRIVHAADHTGRMIETALLAAVASSDRIQVLEDHFAVDLLLGTDPASGQHRCGGALVLDHAEGRTYPVRARITMLATGGAGQVYRHTTNPAIATGDGLAMAYRAGALLANLEFIQFHPTAFYPTTDPAFLISEAVRGEGAVLRRSDGEAFMDRHHRLGSLAPRDVVARAIDRELTETGEEHVLLDLEGIRPERFRERFPGITAHCEAQGVDLAHGIPVVPAAHYVCGGVVTDAWARTSIHGLLAAGEIACTGVHGANRLASNSLLEALVFSHRASVTTARDVDSGDWIDAAPALAGDADHPPLTPDPDLEGDRREVRSLMWSEAGIVRTTDRLAGADEVLAQILARQERLAAGEPGDLERHQLRNLTQTAHLIVRSARMRRESRGLHYMLDRPWRDNEGCLRDTLLRR
jgi:L-aspartate oxidase